MKKGQVTIFIILGITLVLILILLNVSNTIKKPHLEPKFSSHDSDSITYYITLCLDTTLKKGAAYTGLENLGNFLTDHLKDCVDLNVFRKQGFDINDGRISANVQVYDRVVSAYINYPLEIKKGTATIKLEKFESALRLQKTLQFTSNSAILTTDDNQLELDVAPNTNAILHNNQLRNIEVKIVSSSSDQNIFSPIVYELRPSGATFDPPVILRLKYQNSNLPQGFNEKGLRILTRQNNDSEWQALPTSVDLSTRTLSANLYHFSEVGVGSIRHEEGYLDKTDLLTNRQYEVNFLGIWIDPHQYNSYYATYPSLTKIGRSLYLTACTSGHSITAGIPPDWTDNSKQAFDRVRQWVSNDEGGSWNPTSVLIRARETSPSQEDLYQGACTSSSIYFNGNYYLFFESYIAPTQMVGIFVARAASPQDSYQVLTKNGWQNIPTADEWQPVLRPDGLRNDPNLERQAFFLKYKNQQGNHFWGAGVPWVTQKNGQIYLYYVDTTRFVCDISTCKEISTIKDGKTIYGVPYTMVAVGTYPTNFEKASINEVTQGDIHNLQLNTKWLRSTARYFPDADLFIDFFIQAQNGTFGPSILYQISENGIDFNLPKTLAIIPKQLEVAKDTNELHSAVNRKTAYGLAVQGDRFGYGSLSNLRFAAMISRVLDPAWGWETSYPELYGLALVPKNTLKLVITSTFREIRADGSSYFYACGKNYGLSPYVHIIWPNAKSASDHIWIYPGGPLQYSYYTDKNTLNDCFWVPLDKDSAGYLEYLRTSGTGSATIEIINQPGGESNGHISTPVPMNPLGIVGY